MDEYLEQYYDILINTKDIRQIKEYLPTIKLDKTKRIINILTNKLHEELNLSIELNDIDYSKHLIQVINLLKNSIENKEEKKEENIPFSKENIIIFSPFFLRA